MTIHSNKKKKLLNKFLRCQPIFACLSLLLTAMRSLAYWFLVGFLEQQNNRFILIYYSTSFILKQHLFQTSNKLASWLWHFIQIYVYLKIVLIKQKNIYDTHRDNKSQKMDKPTHTFGLSNFFSIHYIKVLPDLLSW